MPIKTKTQAQRDGDRRYYTGRPCRYGHDAPRRTSNGVCVACAKRHLNRSRHQGRDNPLNQPTLRDVCPCDRCEFRRHCAEQETACPAFLKYVRRQTWCDDQRRPVYSLAQANAWLADES